MEFKHICVVGLGYVGLPTAAVFASRGILVSGIDVNPSTVETINAGRSHIVEPDLDMVVHAAVSTKKLSAYGAPVEADAFILAVPTPFDNARAPDLRYLEAATRSIAPVLKKGDLVIVESTVPVGATAKVGAWLAEERPDINVPSLGENDAPHDICVAHSPERVLPGHVLMELVRNDRVIGGLGSDCAERAAALYGIVVEGEMHLTDAPTAELVKLAENAFRDVNIAFANELANVSETLGIDVRDVVNLANRHPRVSILNPGPGVGGHCIAVDPWFIAASAPDDTPLIKTARGVNDGRPKKVAASIAALPSVVDGAPVACLGLSYKADIDDMRESPSIEVIHALRGLIDNPILIVEPYAKTLPASLGDLAGVSLCPLSRALEESGAVVLLTDHKSFAGLANETDLAGKDLLDTRGAWGLTRSRQA